MCMKREISIRGNPFLMLFLKMCIFNVCVAYAFLLVPSLRVARIIKTALFFSLPVTLLLFSLYSSPFTNLDLLVLHF